MNRKGVPYPELAAIVGSTVPNYQGMFLRGHGSQNHTKNNGTQVGNTDTTHSSGGLGEIQGDGIREAYGWATWDINMSQAPTGIFSHQNGEDSENYPLYFTSGYQTAKQLGRIFDNLEIRFSRSFPTANEMRPANRAVKWLIFAGN